MKKLIRKFGLTVAIAVPLALSLGVVDAPSSALAETTCDKVRGTIICVTSEEAGRSDRVRKVETTSKKGSFSSSHDEDCSKGVSNPSGTHTRDC